MNIKKVKIDRQAIAQLGYKLPFSFDKVEISQGYNGPYSHFPTERGFNTLYDNRYCIDFKLPFGTPILAAKSGRIFGIVDYFSDYYEGLKLERGIKSSPNFIILKHKNGFNTLYSHLEKGSAEVMEKQEVMKGQVIAKTGRSGWIGPTPHLHFSVVEDSKSRLSFPVIFDDYKGPLEHSSIENYLKPHAFIL